MADYGREWVGRIVEDCGLGAMFMACLISAKRDTCINIMKWQGGQIATSHQGQAVPFMTSIAYPGGPQYPQDDIDNCIIFLMAMRDKFAEARAYMSSHGGEHVAFTYPGNATTEALRNDYTANTLWKAMIANNPFLKDTPTSHILGASQIASLAAAFMKDGILTKTPSIDNVATMLKKGSEQSLGDANAGQQLFLHTADAANKTEKYGGVVLAFNVVLIGMVTAGQFQIKTDAREGSAGMTAAGTRLFATLAAWWCLLCRLPACMQCSPSVESILATLQSIIERILNETRTSNKHFDDICKAISLDNSAWECKAISTKGKSPTREHTRRPEVTTQKPPCHQHFFAGGCRLGSRCNFRHTGTVTDQDRQKYDARRAAAPYAGARVSQQALQPVPPTAPVPPPSMGVHPLMMPPPGVYPVVPHKKGTQ